MTEPRDDKPAAWRAYFESTAMLMQELESRLKEACGLDLGDFNVLLVLSESPQQRMRMGELAKSIAFAPGRLTYRIGTLEQRGWVRREATAGDRRGTDAVLTEAGRKALRRARPQHARHVDELFLRRVSPEQAAVLLEVFGPLRTESLGDAGGEHC